MPNGILKGTVLIYNTETRIYYCINATTGPLVQVRCREETAFQYQMNCISGMFSFSLPAGTYDMTVTCSGYLPKNKNGIIITAEQTRNAKVYLKPNS